MVLEKHITLSLLTPQQHGCALERVGLAIDQGESQDLVHRSLRLVRS
jgi:hypothetical protein